jgi:LAO/AO transport system kinase
VPAASPGVVSGAELGRRLRDGDLSAAPAVLNLVENRSAAAAAHVTALQHETSPVRARRRARRPPRRRHRAARRREVVAALDPRAAWRARGRSVAVLAVDPSSRRSGGALLGDRARIEVDPADRSVLHPLDRRRPRLGRARPATRAAAHALAAAFDVVVIETVGVGPVRDRRRRGRRHRRRRRAAGSGDALQFIKAGIMEVPDVLVVTKADLGVVATRALRDLRAALRSLGERDTRVVSVSSVPPAQGIDALVDALDAHRASLDLAARRVAARRASALADFAVEHGERGRARPRRAPRGAAAARRRRPGLDVPSLVAALETEAGVGLGAPARPRHRPRRRRPRHAARRAARRDEPRHRADVRADRRRVRGPRAHAPRQRRRPVQPLRRRAARAEAPPRRRRPAAAATARAARPGH